MDTLRALILDRRDQTAIGGGHDELAAALLAILDLCAGRETVTCGEVLDVIRGGLDRGLERVTT